MSRCSIVSMLAAIAAAGLVGLATPVSAQTTPTTVDDCLKVLHDLVEEAHGIDLLDDQIDFAENYIALMERHCLASEFSEAMTAAAEVRKILDTNK